jgi:predicted  nucleic acid-binding Zn-ribbon protein
LRSTAFEGAATDAWTGKVNAIVKRVDALDCNLKAEMGVQLTEMKAEMGERFGGADQKLTDVKSEMAQMTETFSNVDQKMSVMDQKMSEIDEKMSALETKMDANVDKILGAIGLLGHSV